MPKSFAHTNLFHLRFQVKKLNKDIIVQNFTIDEINPTACGSPLSSVTLWATFAKCYQSRGYERAGLTHPSQHSRQLLGRLTKK